MPARTRRFAGLRLGDSSMSGNHRSSPHLRVVNLDDAAIIMAAKLWHEIENEIDDLRDREAELVRGPLAKFGEVQGLDPRGAAAGGWQELREQSPEKYALLVKFEAAFVPSGLGSIVDKRGVLWERQDTIAEALRRAAPVSTAARAARASVMAAITLGILYGFTNEGHELASAEVAFEDLKHLAAHPA